MDQKPQTNSVPPNPAPTRSSTLARLGKRAGVFAFFFFLVKGLAWLIVPTAIAWAASR